MKTYRAKSLSTLLIGMSAFSLFVPAASAQEAMEKVIKDFYSAPAKNLSPQGDSCPDPQSSSSSQAQDDYPDAPSVVATKKPSWTAKVMSRIKFETSTGVAMDPNSPGGAGIKAEFYGVTYGPYQIDQLLMRSGIPITDKPVFTCDVTVAVSPAVPGLAQLAGKAEKADIIAKENGLAWQAGDLKRVDKVINGLTANALTQKITAACAFITASGKMYTCEAGKAPNSFLPASDAGGMTKIENLKGGPDDALRVGSTFSTSFAKCTAGISIGKGAKLQGGFTAFQEALPYNNSSTMVANALISNDAGVNATRLKLPNAFTANMELTTKVGKNGDASLNVTAGKTTFGKPIGSVSGTLTTGNGTVSNTVAAAAGQNYFTSPTSKNPNDYASTNFYQRNSGIFVSDTVKVGNFSAFADEAWNKGVPNLQQSTDGSGMQNYTKKEFGGAYTVLGRVNDAGGLYLSPTAAHTNVTVYGAYQIVKSPDGSTAEGGGFVGGLRIITAGGIKDTFHSAGRILKHPFSKDPDDQDVQTHVTTTEEQHLPAAKPTADGPAPASQPVNP